MCLTRKLCQFIWANLSSADPYTAQHGRLGTCGTHVWHQLAVWCHIPICANTWIRWHAGTLVRWHAGTLARKHTTVPRRRGQGWFTGHQGSRGSAGSTGLTSLAGKNPVISPYGATQPILSILPILPILSLPGYWQAWHAWHTCDVSWMRQAWRHTGSLV